MSPEPPLTCARRTGRKSASSWHGTHNTMQARTLLRSVPLALWLAIAAATVAMFGIGGNTDQPEVHGHSAIRWMTARWNWSGADMSHAWLIPLISLWALWQRRAALRNTAGAPDWRALPIVLLGLLLYLTGLRTQQTRIVLASAILLLWSLPFHAFGWPLARQLIFPCGYLVFCIPFTFLDDLTLPLRLISTTVSAGLLNGLAIPVTRIGTALHIQAGEGFSLDVAHPCSGLRYLVAMIALTSAYAYFTQRGALRRLTLGIASVPLAMIGNIARIVLIAVVGVWLGKDTAVGFYHDYSGYVVFAVATLLMIWVGGLMNRHPGRMSRTAETAAAAPAPARHSPLRQALHPPVTLAALLGATLLLAPAASRVSLEDPLAANITTRLPAAVGTWQGEDLLYCQNEQCNRSFRRSELEGEGKTCPVCGGTLDRMALAERTMLPADTSIARKLYRDPSGSAILATVVLTGRDQRSIHRPQQCLPAQGFAIASRSVLPVPMAGRPPLETTLLHATPARASLTTGQDRLLLAYWFVGGGHVTHDHLRRVFWMGWDNLIHGRRSRWAYVSLQTSTGGNPDRALEQLTGFTAALWPQIHKPPVAPQ